MRNFKLLALFAFIASAPALVLFLSRAPVSASDIEQPTMRYRGAWNAGTSYVVDDVVFYRGAHYVALANNSDTEPQKNRQNATWRIVVDHAVSFFDFRLGRVSSIGTATPQQGGDTFTAVGGGGSAGQAATDNVGPWTSDATSTTAGGDGGWSGLTIWRTTYNPSFVLKGDVSSNALDMRVFAGFSNQTLATMVGADDPAGHYVGFQYSTDRGDTNWQCVSKDGTTQQITNSGVAPAIPQGSAGRQIFEGQLDDASEARFYIDGALVCTHSTNLPATAINTRFIWAVETRIAANRNVGLEWVIMQADK